jgi:hypothetical protein
VRPSLVVEERREVDREALTEVELAVDRLECSPMRAHRSADRNPSAPSQRRADDDRLLLRNVGGRTGVGDGGSDRQPGTDVHGEPMADLLGELAPRGEAEVDPHDRHRRRRELRGRSRLAAEGRHGGLEGASRQLLDAPAIPQDLDGRDVDRQRNRVREHQLVLQVDASVVARVPPRRREDGLDDRGERGLDLRRLAGCGCGHGLAAGAVTASGDQRGRGEGDERHRDGHRPHGTAVGTPAV